MKTTLVSTALALFTTITAAVTTTTTAATPDNTSFKLKAGPTAPAGLAGRTVKWDGILDGNLGFSNSGAEELSAIIQHDEIEGIAFYARNTALRIYLRPTHGTPEYFAKLGNPLHDAVPALTLSTDFTIGPGGVFGYHGQNGVWSACGGPDKYTLYYGVVTTPPATCTTNFGLYIF
ncbi:hypothetical protein L873DRAFT_1780880 [Choiromyces venosus 120613-1]|uniref:Uncharacterized protein n=1 Tax=Choiromyces venosus 120613-1 TaxID=1336337 RepID=A0A3N4J3C2_9PEZI|nr:hypothetical protein L873DRAFT_1780880 [Choiromyces venosus 120613-1]